MQQPRTMVVWRTPNGQAVAHVTQGVQIKQGRPVAVYNAHAGGEAVPKDRFKCAIDQVERWLRANGIAAKRMMT